MVYKATDNLGGTTEGKTLQGVHPARRIVDAASAQSRVPDEGPAPWGAMELFSRKVW